MSGGQALGHWEVKNCHSFKALAVCKQEVSGYRDTLMPVPHIDRNAPCPTGWESHKGLSHCYKVVQRVNIHKPIIESHCLVLNLLFNKLYLLINYNSVCSCHSCSVCLFVV